MSVQNWVCSVCEQGPEDGLELTPSGKAIKAHKDGPDKCKGVPKTREPEPVKIVPASTKPSVGECVECGEEGKKLKSGKIAKHTNSQTLATCEQRPDVTANCPACERPDIPMFRMRLKNHKDLKAGSKCPASGKTLTEAEALTKKAPNRPKAKKEPKGIKTDNVYKTLSPLAKSQFKAKRLGEELKAYADPWRYTIENGPDSDQATLVARRGSGKDIEEMRISWWGGACIGGEGKITHELRGRKIAVRNANAVRARGQMTHEQSVAEANRVATRKQTGPKKTKKTPEEIRALLPFDPSTADDDVVLAALREGRTIRWTRTTDGREETDTVKKLPKQPISRTKSGLRNLTFTGSSSTRTIRVDNLLSVA